MNPNRGETMPAALALVTALVAVSLPIGVGPQEKKAAGKAPEPVEAPVSTCIGCHAIPGYHASFPQVYRVPKIGGQSREYIEAALRAYQKGERNQPTMRAVARELTDQQIAALATYYAGRGQ